MIQHIVMWNLFDEAEGGTKAENAAKIKSMLEALTGRIDGLVSMKVGAGVNPKGYDLCLVSVFESPEALKAYDTHPEHLKVRAFVSKVRKERVLCDFEL